MFRDKGCTHCHGASAQGTRKGPSLAGVRKERTAVQVADQILNGGQKMPSFEDSLSKQELQLLVSFLRARHRPAIPPPAPESTPASTPQPTPDANPENAPLSNPEQ